MEIVCNIINGCHTAIQIGAWSWGTTTMQFAFGHYWSVVWGAMCS